MKPINFRLSAALPPALSRRAGWLLTNAVAALALAGCANWSARYANVDEREGGVFAENSIDRSTDVPKAFVEFSELGSYHDPTQIERAEALIRDQKRPLVVTYIHGWHNSADSHDVEKFQSFIERLAKTRTVIDNGFNVVGVYLAWNGESWTLPILNTFTIWDRKAAAERLASNGDCLDAMLRVGRAARQTNPTRHYNFYIGHSLGGLILERAIAHTLLTERHSGAGQLPWNLALMLNPASDAVLTRQLMASLSARYTFKNGQFVSGDGGSSIHRDRPTILALTADNDAATGRVFPISAAVAEFGDTRWPRVNLPQDSGSTKPPVSISEKNMHRTTPGNNRHLVNYRIDELVDGPKPPAAGGRVKENPAFDANLANDIRDRTFFTSETQNAPSASRREARRQGAADEPEAQWKTWRFNPVDGTKDKNGIPWNGPNVPYWNVRVDQHIINDHGGIWSDNSMAMMAAIFRMHVPKARESAPPPAIQRGATRPLAPVETMRAQ